MSRLLDWGHGSHFSSTPAPCRHCGGLTHLRTTNDRPAHKTCEEQAPDGEGNQPQPPQMTTQKRKTRR